MAAYFIVAKHCSVTPTDDSNRRLFSTGDEDIAAPFEYTEERVPR